MELINLALVFIVIIIIIGLRRPLWQGISGGILASLLLYRIGPVTALGLFWKSTKSWDTISVLLAFYCVTFLQKMMEYRNHLKAAQSSFNSIFRHRALNTALSSAIIGLLPSAAVMSFCCEMVEGSTEGFFDDKEKMAVSCYCRHIPEMFVPTFTGVLLGLSLTGLDTAPFVIAMIPMVIVAYIIIYVFYLRRLKGLLPEEPGKTRGEQAMNLLRHLWPLIVVVIIIIAFDLSVLQATPIVIAVNLLTDRFKLSEIKVVALRAAESITLVNMYLIMLFKGVINYTGVIGLLPDFFGQFPIPTALVFALIFFFGTIISGSQAIIALCIPMAVAAIPGGGLPLFVLLMSVTWGAMQISPTHVCSFVAADYYKTTLGDLVVRDIPMIVLYCAIAYFYHMLLAVFI